MLLITWGNKNESRWENDGIPWQIDWKCQLILNIIQMNANSGGGVVDYFQNVTDPYLCKMSQGDKLKERGNVYNPVKQW